MSPDSYKDMRWGHAGGDLLQIHKHLHKHIPDCSEVVLSYISYMPTMVSH